MPNALLNLLLSPRLEREVAWLCDLALAATLCVFPSVLGLVAGVAYMTLRDALPLLGRRSFGKSIFDLRVVRTADRQPAPGQVALLRNLLLAVPPITIIDVVRFATTGRRLTDEWLGTDVACDKRDGNRPKPRDPGGAKAPARPAAEEDAATE